MGKIVIPCDEGQVSDGHHTFDELYKHRMLLFIALVNAYPEISWKSEKHEDGSMFDGGWFIAGMQLGEDMITYHIRSSYWPLAKVKALEFAPPWDGHDSIDVLVRLRKWLTS